MAEESVKEHKCKELDAANARMHKAFTVEYYSSFISGLYADMLETRGEHSWKLLNNDDDHYSAEFINYCPFCGEKLP